ncbi:MAG: polyphosphate kinase 2 family protein [Micrococcus sp.]|nr:polyphosphate kinase 2 family protein [Micrococcus sp.]
MRARRDGETVGLADVDPRERIGYDGKKAHGEEDLAGRAEYLADLQELLYAAGRADPEGAPSLLVVVQGMDTSGKGGLMRTVAGAMDPQGVATKAFGAPTTEELSHDFLWRIEKEMPGPGQITVFDRSHYEDVLIHRVEGLSSPEEVERRYGAIREFEAEAVARGTRIIKVILHISKDEQKDRLTRRLHRPDRYWKYDPSDIDARKKWDEYWEAYDLAVAETDTDDAPWFIIPADRKWFSRLAVQELVIHELEQMQLAWPEPDFDVEAERERIAAS